MKFFEHVDGKVWEGLSQDEIERKAEEYVEAMQAAVLALMVVFEGAPTFVVAAACQLYAKEYMAAVSDHHSAKVRELSQGLLDYLQRRFHEEADRTLATHRQEVN